MIYLDNAATTQPDEDVVSAMIPYLTKDFGNPSSLYSFSRGARDAVERARGQVAGLFNCDKSQVVFTSGGSEANSLAILGARQFLTAANKRHVVVSAYEHDSIMSAAKSLENEGFSVTYIRPDGGGVVHPDDVAAAITCDTGLVSVMYVNNEVGAVNEVGKIGEVCEAKGILFHTDCVQAAGCFDIDVQKLHCTSASISAHKIHGCKGTGALFIKEYGIVAPIIAGGAHQEHGLRGGTENVAGIVGFGVACESAKYYCDSTNSFCTRLKNVFYNALRDSLAMYHYEDKLVINGRDVQEPGRILNITIKDVDAETMIYMLDTREVYVSAGSACRSLETEPSRVLTVMGISPEDARCSLRVSFSDDNGREEVKIAAGIVAQCAAAILNINNGDFYAPQN